MCLSILILMNGNDSGSSAIKKLLKSKIPGYRVSFYISEDGCNVEDITECNGEALSEDHQSQAIDYSLYDVCVVKGEVSSNDLVKETVSVICWDKMEDLSVKFDVFFQLHRHLKKFPLALSGLTLTEVLHSSQDCIIYKGIDVNAKSVAIKRFKFQSDQLSHDAIQECLNGISLQCGIRSHGLVDFYEGGVSNNAFYLVMEYLSLGNLRRYLDSRDKVLPLKRALLWFDGIANALNAVHQAGLIHRDLKIDNIMLREDGLLALTDYGVSKNILLNAEFLDEDELHASPYYVSPELIAGEQCSESSDIYSLGIIFYELLTGSRPYDGNNSHDLMVSHINDPIPALPRYLELFQPCLDKMMAKSPKNRFLNMTELLRLFNFACRKHKQSGYGEKTPPYLLPIS